MLFVRIYLAGFILGYLVQLLAPEYFTPDVYTIYEVLYTWTNLLIAFGITAICSSIERRK